MSGIVAWFTGLSGAGKSTIAVLVDEILTAHGRKVITLDGDAVREKNHDDLGFSPDDIYENNRRFIGLCQQSILDHDVVLVPKISPFLEQRATARRELGDAYLEIYVHASLDEVTRRDPKGLYRDSQEGRLPGLVGVAPEVPYEPPEDPELVLETEKHDVETCARHLADYLLGARAHE